MDTTKIPTLAIYDPQDEPFGPLSNMYKAPLHIVDTTTINNKKITKKTTYNSVANYIWTSILMFDDNKKMIMKYQNLKNIKDFALSRMKDEIDYINIDSFKVAYAIRFMDPVFREKLLATGAAPIIYENDAIFGVDKDGNGKNIVGRILMEIREYYAVLQYNIQKKMEEEMEMMYIYRAYMAYLKLASLINHDNSDLHSYIGKTVDQILQEASMDPRVQFNPNAYSYDVVMSLYKKGFLPDGIDNQNADIAKLVRRDYLRKYMISMENEAKNKIFRAYLGVIYSDEEVKSLMDEIRRHPDGKGVLGFMQDKIYGLYESGILPSEVGKAMENINIPTREEVEDAESYRPAKVTIAEIISGSNNNKIAIESDESSSGDEFDYDSQSDDDKYGMNPRGKKLPKKPRVRRAKARREKQEREGMGVIDPSMEQELQRIDEIYGILGEEEQYEPAVDIEPIKFTADSKDYWFLSPVTRIHPDGTPAWVIINNIPYPSPFDYAMTRAFGYLDRYENDEIYMHASYLLKDSAADPYNLLNYNTFQDIIDIYTQIYDMFLYTNLTGALTRAIDVKFSGSLGPLLVATGTVQIEYADKDDPILGTGEGIGMDETGKALMRKRASLISEGVQPKQIKPVRFETLSGLMSNDESLLAWFNMRLKDVCTAILLFSEYLFNKIGKAERSLSVGVVRHVVLNLYNTCGFGEVRAYNNIQIPRQFSDMVKSYLDPLDISSAGIRVIFDYMLYLVSHILKNASESKDSSIKDDISRIQAMLVNSIDDKNIHSKYLNAMINIIFKTRDFVVKHRASKYVVGMDDIQFAAKLLAPGSVIVIPTSSETVSATPVEDMGGRYEATVGGSSYVLKKAKTGVHEKELYVLIGKREGEKIVPVDRKEEHELYVKYNILPRERKGIANAFEKRGMTVEPNISFSIVIYSNMLVYGLSDIDMIRKKSRIAFFSDNDTKLYEVEDIDEYHDEEGQIIYGGLGENMMEGEEDEYEIRQEEVDMETDE
jgi:predicted NAD-dependent protein-ADP-ribosyltransferase YbiA (DUF1768 family)